MIQELGSVAPSGASSEELLAALFLGGAIGLVLCVLILVIIFDRFCFFGRDGAIHRFIPKRKGVRRRR